MVTPMILMLSEFRTLQNGEYENMALAAFHLACNSWGLGNATSVQV